MSASPWRTCRFRFVRRDRVLVDQGQPAHAGDREVDRDGRTEPTRARDHDVGVLQPRLPHLADGEDLPAVPLPLGRVEARPPSRRLLALRRSTAGPRHSPRGSAPPLGRGPLADGPADGTEPGWDGVGIAARQLVGRLLESRPGRRRRTRSGTPACPRYCENRGRRRVEKPGGLELGVALPDERGREGRADGGQKVPDDLLAGELDHMHKGYAGRLINVASQLLINHDSDRRTRGRPRPRAQLHPPRGPGLRGRRRRQPRDGPVRRRERPAVPRRGRRRLRGRDRRYPEPWEDRSPPRAALPVRDGVAADRRGDRERPRPPSRRPGRHLRELVGRGKGGLGDLLHLGQRGPRGRVARRGPGDCRPRPEPRRERRGPDREGGDPGPGARLLPDAPVPLGPGRRGADPSPPRCRRAGHHHRHRVVGNYRADDTGGVSPAKHGPGDTTPRAPGTVRRVGATTVPDHVQNESAPESNAAFDTIISRITHSKAYWEAESEW